jgi:hypothetical protein
VRRATAMAVVVCGGGVALSAPARAETDLRLRDLPAAPVRLHMRRQGAAPATAAPPIVIPPARPAARPRATERLTPMVVTSSGAPVSAGTPKDLVFQLGLGYGVDGAGLQGEGFTYGEGDLEVGAERTVSTYAPVRGYGWADLYAGSRGYGFSWLNGYLATHWQITGGTVGIAPIPTIYDRAEHVPVRSAWVETDGMFRNRVLGPIRARAGRQYFYSVAPMHIDGLSLAWEARGIDARVAVGATVSEYETVEVQREGDSYYGAAELRVDLGAWWRSVPVVVTAAALGTAYSHAEYSVAYARPSRDVVVRATARTLGGERARETVTARLQLRDIAQLTVDVVHRTANDWRWDPGWVRDDEAMASQRYLDLGPVLPRLESSARLGFTWLDNIDVLVRGGAAFDLPDADEPTGLFTPGWFEVGGTAEGRLRRALALGVTGLTRQYDRVREVGQIIDVEAEPGAEETCAVVGAGAPTCAAQPFPTDLSDVGEVAFHQVGGHLRYSAGARRFSAKAEMFWRRTELTDLYVDDTNTPEEEPQEGDTSRDTEDNRVAGRFTIEAWPMARLRIRAEYELTTLIETALEIRGYKSLRLLAEASF